MGYKAFIIFYVLLIETFVELMIKAMDMEIIDWQTLDNWKKGKLAFMVGILVYQAFFRWIAFIAIRKNNISSDEVLVTPLKLSRIPWFFFGNIFHSILLLTFGFIIWKLNKAAWPLYYILVVGAAELIIYLVVGVIQKWFSLVMGKNSIIISRGYLTSIHLKEVKVIEKKYDDELYISMKNGSVHSVSFAMFEKKDLETFLLKLKKSAETHNFYFGNDLL